MHRLKRQVAGSQVVDSVDKLETLEQLLSVPQGSLKLTTLFSTQDHGWEPAEFHSRCHSRGATLTLVQGIEGSGPGEVQLLYGGYASVSWNSSNQFQADQHAFLFRFACPSQPTKLIVADKFGRVPNGQEVFGHQSYGPCFGYRHDCFTFDGGHDILREQFHCGHNTFTLSGPLINTAKVPKTQDKWIVEVLQVGSVDSLDSPWQQGVFWSAEVSKDQQD